MIHLIRNRNFYFCPPLFNFSRILILLKYCYHVAKGLCCFYKCIFPFNETQIVFDFSESSWTYHYWFHQYQSTKFPKQLAFVYFKKSIVILQKYLSVTIDLKCSFCFYNIIFILNYYWLLKSFSLRYLILPGAF